MHVRARAVRKFIALSLAAIGLFGCAANASDDASEDEAAQVDEHLLAGRHLDASEVADVLRSAGFPEDVVPPMVCTAFHESSFYERASHKNHNGTVDRGLFQINSINLGHDGCNANASTIYGAQINARCALTVYRDQGLTAWYGYKSHRAECDRYRIP